MVTASLSWLTHKRGNLRRIPSSNSSITRGTSPMGSSKYRPPSRPHSCSKSTASHPRRTRTTTHSRREDFAVLGSLGGYLPTRVSLGETLHNTLVLLTRLRPSRKIRFPNLSDRVHSAARSTLGGLPQA